MRATILIPHWKTGRLTAYSIAQLLKFKGKHEIDIVVIDNNPGDGSVDFLEPFSKEIAIVNYPKDRIQSHGAAFDHVLPAIKNEWFITMESDSFPTQDDWLGYYEAKINEGYDCIGSLLWLSGGQIIHPCGALYRKSVWEEARRFAENMPYAYFPNMSRANNFDNHLMVHHSIFDDFLDSPDDYIELSKDYIPYSKEKAIEKLNYYMPIAKGVFHNGMGGRNEFLLTFGQRNIESEPPFIMQHGKQPKLLNRIGYEPGAWICYYQLATGKKLFFVPTETKWLPNREHQNQEYTLMENGLTHIWAGSAHLGMKDTELHHVYEHKKNQIASFYDSLPGHQKIK